MRERKCIVVSLGGVIVARVIERIYNESRWLMVEEFDVSADVAALMPKPKPVEMDLAGTVVPETETNAGDPASGE